MYNMGLEEIRRAFEDVVAKQNSLQVKCDLVVNQITYELEHALGLLKQQPDQDPAVSIESILGGLKRGIAVIEREMKLETAHEEVEAALSKCFKVLEEELDVDLNENKMTGFDVQTVNQIIADHLRLKGMFEMEDCFITEAGATKDDTFRAQFVELYEILEALRTGDYRLAQNWINSNREKLQELGSNIEVMLHLVRFAEFLKQGNNSTDALQFVRTYLTPLVASHGREVERSMVWLLYMGNLENCPDSYYAQANWESFSDKLAHQFCILLRQSWRSPLAVTVEAGAESLLAPSRWLELLSMKRTGQAMWIPSKSAVALGDAFQFHSVFVCPGIRKQATNENPPMRLPCGHVYSNEYVLMMSEVDEGTRFICPRCLKVCELINAGDCISDDDDCIVY